MSDLLKLAERCEQATGPDRELDGDIHLLLYGKPGDKIDWSFAALIKPYTASLDAAITLVPATHYWSAGTTAQDGYEHYDDMDFGWGQVVHRERGESINVEYAATPALALCAAALRARASQDQTNA